MYADLNSFLVSVSQQLYALLQRKTFRCSRPQQALIICRTQSAQHSYASLQETYQSRIKPTVHEMHCPLEKVTVDYLVAVQDADDLIVRDTPAAQDEPSIDLGSALQSPQTCMIDHLSLCTAVGSI